MFVLSLSLESLESFLVSDPQPLKLMARLSQTMGPRPQPLLHLYLPMTPRSRFQAEMV